jgi:lysophospholipase L1-like esterase
MVSPPTITMNSTANANSSVVPANYDSKYTATDPLFTYVGGVVITSASTGPPGAFWAHGAGSNFGTGNGYQGTGSVYFKTSDANVDLSFVAQNNIQCAYRISIDQLDGNGLKATALQPRTDIQALADFSGHRVKIANGSSAMRGYRIEFENFLYFAGVDVSGTIQKWDPAGLTILVTGDSHTAGTGATSNLLGMAQRLKEALGVDNVLAQGQGGTGYLATSVAGTETMRARIPNEITPRNPDLIIDLAGYNDQVSSAAAIQAEVTAYYAALTAALPNVPVIKIGPPRRGISTGAGFTPTQTRNDAIKAAVQADSRYGRLVFFVDSWAADWEHGTGRVGATTGDGNADTWVGTDNVHRTDTGHNGWQMQMGPAIRSALGISEAPAISIPATNLKAVYSTTRLSTWTGSCIRVQRASDSAQMDIGFAGNVVDKAGADAFAAGSALTIAKVYDQSGNGLDLAQATDANRPIFSSLNEYAGIRPITFDTWPQSAVAKWLDTPVLAGLNRQAISVYMMMVDRCPNQQNLIWEGFSDTGFATSNSFLLGSGGGLGVNFGSLIFNTFFPRSHLQAITTVCGGSNVRARFDGVERTFATGAISSSAIQGMRFGKSSLNTQYNSQNDVFCIAIYAQADAAAANLVVENALNASFNPDRASNTSWTYRLVEDGNSLMSGVGAASLQSAGWQGGFGRGPQGDVRAWEYYNMGLAGQTLATAYTNRARVLALSDVTKSKNVLHIIDPTNDIGVITYTSVADAQTGNTVSAQNLYNNYFLPYVVAAQAAGFTKIVTSTILPRTNFNVGTGNFRGDCRNYYNSLLIAGAAANGYIVADVGAISQLQNTADLTYFLADGIHLTSTGYALVEAVRKPLEIA